MLSTNARPEEIYHLAVTTVLTSVEELSARFEVTASTIRRDLALVNGQGRLARTYDGAKKTTHVTAEEITIRRTDTRSSSNLACL